MAPRRQDLHALRGHVRDPAARDLAVAGGPQHRGGQLTAAPPAVEARRQARRELRRRRLLDAALGLFADRGYHDTTVDDIVASARTSKSAFYEFFESKDDCCRELLAERGGELIKAVVDAAASGSDRRDRMRRGIRQFVVSCAAEGELARLLLVESVGLTTEIEQVRSRLHGRFAAMVEAEVGAAAATDGFYAAADPAVFGRAVVGAVNEVTATLLTGALRGTPEKAANELALLFAPPA